ncbi:MAG: hypothetical protein EKK37_00825 [Sphingobacteriales bacterium]|nr:MAG: hypothetical protein EKK37_00825 [Sphingobacteriales bacterium]
MEKKQKRQIKTTLSDQYQALLDKVISFTGKKESEIVREAVSKYLRNAIVELDLPNSEIIARA